MGKETPELQLVPHEVIGIANYNDVKVGDQIEAFSSEKVATELNS